MKNEWDDSDGSRFEIACHRGTIRLGMSDANSAIGFSVESLNHLDETIRDLTGLRAVFERKTALLSEATIAHWQHNLYYDIHPGDVRSIPHIVAQYATDLREELKAVILYLGDSRRPDRELDLGRDDRTEAMMSEEERALMPSEVQDGKRVYYCTVQRRKQ